MKLRDFQYIDTYIKAFERIPYFLKFLVIVVINLCLIEYVAMCVNKKNLSTQPFLINLKQKKTDVDAADNVGLDPLLGWNYNPEKISYATKNNCVYLESMNGSSADTISIFITGGSATDIVFLEYNWPVFLSKKLKEKGINHRMYIAAVNGYDTGQELFTLLRDGLKIPNLDYHISYTGANEILSDSSYVTKYEYNLYKKWAAKDDTPVVLPNTLTLLLKKLKANRSLYLTPYETYNINFIEKNITVMKKISEEYNYLFIPIIQPVTGVKSPLDYYDKSKYSTQILSLIDNIIKERKDFYSKLFKSEKLKEIKCFDFTGIFSNTSESPFIDDCHVKKEYQTIISDSIYSIIAKKR